MVYYLWLNTTRSIALRNGRRKEVAVLQEPFLTKCDSSLPLALDAVSRLLCNLCGTGSPKHVQTLAVYPQRWPNWRAGGPFLLTLARAWRLYHSCRPDSAKVSLDAPETIIAALSNLREFSAFFQAFRGPPKFEIPPPPKGTSLAFN